MSRLRIFDDHAPDAPLLATRDPARMAEALSAIGVQLEQWVPAHPVVPGDPPEAIERGMIDLGRVAADALFLGIDPYPRKPAAVFEPIVEPDDPGEHPFAALQALKTPAKPPRSRKPKGD